MDSFGSEAIGKGGGERRLWRWLTEELNAGAARRVLADLRALPDEFDDGCALPVPED